MPAFLRLRAPPIPRAGLHPTAVDDVQPILLYQSPPSGGNASSGGLRKQY